VTQFPLAQSTDGKRRLLVVSHPAVLAVNQLPYAALSERGWEPFLVTPARWRHEYSDVTFSPEVLPALEGRVAGRRVVLTGKVQRHLYLTRIKHLIRTVRPAVAFVEQEPTSVSGFQWGTVLHREGIPYGLQCAENLERPWPLMARLIRRSTLASASFVVSRSPAAAAIVSGVQPNMPTPVIPHHVPAWEPAPDGDRDGFVIGFAGRLVPEKGLDVLIDAAAGIEGAAVRLVGNGPLRDELQRQAAERGVKLEIDTGVTHEQMASAYAGFDVLVLPSRTTPTWAEQFGRVLVEALWCGIPVVGSDSGEIPWVINTTGGGLVFAEGDPGALRDALNRLRGSPVLRKQLGDRGREEVRRQFSVDAVAAGLERALLTACRAHTTSRGVTF
jgi:glycosyltransferase involved in cell wall biosynthesis